MPNTSAKILLDTNRTIAEISPLLFSGFVEHMGRCVYEGIYDPKSKHADEEGLRTDVLDALREQGYTMIRYPGGNFLSGYNWLDGVGPKDKRPRNRELAWQSIETNQFGTNEFMSFCKKINALPMMAANMGTGSIDMAAALVEYCNAPAGTKWADLRVSHGVKDPYNVEYWCVGNEMDGPWQIGHLDMYDYGKKAREAAKMMKWQDPNVKLVLCGSSNDRMPTFPEWDRVALEHCWDKVDYLSIHMYDNNVIHPDSTSYLAHAKRFEDYVDTMAATLRYVKAKTRGKNDVYLSWDEWQVWPPSRHDGGWTEAPHIAECDYTLEDALVVAQWLNVFLRKADVVKIACVAQIVNIISWLRTEGDQLLKQTSFWPFTWVSTMARGNALDALVLAPKIETAEFGGVSALDVSASHNPATGESAVFIVNRSQTDELTTDLVWQDGAPKSIKAANRLSGTDTQAKNTFDKPNTVLPTKVDGLKLDGNTLTVKLPPLSFTAIQFA